MIRKEENLLLGVIARPHGTRGSLLIRLRNINSDEIKKWDWLFVDIDGLLVPFLIHEFRTSDAGSVIVKFDQISSENDARTISGCEVYISKSSINYNKKRISDPDSVSGYRVSDKNLGYIGIAREVSGVASNPLLRITHEDKEWLIPVHEDIIIEIDDTGKQITIDAPEGLFDL